jgi:hypothetical protein
MRLHEFATSTESQQGIDLDEVDLKKAIAAGSLALAAHAGGTPEYTPNKSITPTVTQHQAIKQNLLGAHVEAEIEKLVDIVTSKYNVDTALARHIVLLAKKYEKPVFPRATDLLAIIGIESSFNPRAVSGLRRDPAVGLTQIRPKVWGLNPHELRSNMEQQVSTASDILAKYRSRLRSVDDTVHAYNVGMSAFRRGDHNPGYVQKFKNEKRLYI